MICYQCGAQNREGELICSVCGALNVPPTLPVDVEARLEIESRAATAESIAIDVGSHRFEFLLYDGLTISIGRGNRHTRQKRAAILDLEDLQGHEKGVSRRHAFIWVQDSTVLLLATGHLNK